MAPRKGSAGAEGSGCTQPAGTRGHGQGSASARREQDPRAPSLGSAASRELRLHPAAVKKPGGVSREEAETKRNVQTLRSSCREGTGDVPCAHRGWQGARLSRAHPQHRAQRGAQGSTGGCSCSSGKASSKLGAPAPPVPGKGTRLREAPSPCRGHRAAERARQQQEVASVSHRRRWSRSPDSVCGIHNEMDTAYCSNLL